MSGTGVPLCSSAGAVLCSSAGAVLFDGVAGRYNITWSGHIVATAFSLHVCAAGSATVKYVAPGVYLSDYVYEGTDTCGGNTYDFRSCVYLNWNSYSGRWEMSLIGEYHIRPGTDSDYAEHGFAAVCQGGTNSASASGSFGSASYSYCSGTVTGVSAS